MDSASYLVYILPQTVIVMLARGRRNYMNDKIFLLHIITEICDYAVENEMEPNDTLKTISENILAMLKISTFNNWKGKKNDKRR